MWRPLWAVNYVDCAICCIYNAMLWAMGYGLCYRLYCGLIYGYAMGCTVGYAIR
jgi:hypothetical protein